MPYLANPLGLLALLGIPAVLAIHFLQRKAIETPLSTLFLLERSRQESASGRRFDRLRSSIPLWLQLLAVLLLAWFLAEPRFAHADRVRRVALVLDSSASMSAFRETALERLRAELPAIRGPAAAVDFVVLESDASRPRLYAGDSVDELFAALEAWRPRDGRADPSPALRLARSLVAREGAVIYLTDTPQEALPYGAVALAVGRPLENVGFTGLSFERTEEGVLLWRALVRNYGSLPAERQWWMRSASGRSEPRTLSVAPGAIASIQGAFPTGEDRVTLELTPDAFTLDDVLPLLPPRPKPLLIHGPEQGSAGALTARLLAALEAAERTSDPAAADLSVRVLRPDSPADSPGHALVFVDDEGLTGNPVTGGMLVEPHPLVDGLNWQPLIFRPGLGLPPLAGGLPLISREDQPLLQVHERPGGRHLRFEFALGSSNAVNQPAFLVLVHRFAESIRREKVAPEALNLETGQPIDLALLPGQEAERSILDPHGNLLSREPLAVGPSPRAPLDPGFLTLRQGERLLLEAAVHFADTREADFSECGSNEDFVALGESAAAHLTRRDPWWRVWLLLLLAGLLAAWHFTGGERLRSNRPAAAGA